MSLAIIDNRNGLHKETWFGFYQCSPDVDHRTACPTPIESDLSEFLKLISPSCQNHEICLSVLPWNHNVPLVEKCYYVLGLAKCLEFLYVTEDIEESGGLLVLVRLHWSLIISIFHANRMDPGVVPPVACF